MLGRLDYPGVGPEHSFLKDLGRAEYYSITDEEALEGMKSLISYCNYCWCLEFVTSRGGKMGGWAMGQNDQLFNTVEKGWVDPSISFGPFY